MKVSVFSDYLFQSHLFQGEAILKCLSWEESAIVVHVSLFRRRKKNLRTTKEWGQNTHKGSKIKFCVIPFVAESQLQWTVTEVWKEKKKKTIYVLLSQSLSNWGVPVWLGFLGRVSHSATEVRMGKKAHSCSDFEGWWLSQASCGCCRTVSVLPWKEAPFHCCWPVPALTCASHSSLLHRFPSQPSHTTALTLMPSGAFLLMFS